MNYRRLNTNANLPQVIFGVFQITDHDDEYSIMAEPVIPVSRATLIPVARAIYSRV